MTYTAENTLADGSTSPGARPRNRTKFCFCKNNKRRIIITAPPLRPSRHVPHTQQLEGGKTDVLSSANSPSTASLQQRCHLTSILAQSQSSLPMPCPRLHRAATVWQDLIQPSIWNTIFASRARGKKRLASRGSVHRPGPRELHWGGLLM